MQRDKPLFRASMAALPFPEKVDLLIDLQERLVPVCAQRGECIVPWKRDRESTYESRKRDKQASFYERLSTLTPPEVTGGYMQYLEMSNDKSPEIMDICAKGMSYAN